MLLAEVGIGERVRVVNILKGKGAWDRLIDLGIIPGTEIEIIASHPFRGPLLLKVGTSHVALGRGIARGIEVERVE